MPKPSIFIGATLVSHADADSYFAAIRVPANITKQETKDKYIAKTIAARGTCADFSPRCFEGGLMPNDSAAENPAHRPMVASLSSICIMDADGKALCHASAGSPRGHVAQSLVSYLARNYRSQFPDSMSTAPQSHALFVGFDLKNIFRIAAFECAKQVPCTSSVSRPSPRMLKDPTGVYDIKDVLLPKGDQKDLDVYSLCRYAGIEVDPELISCAAKQADLARRLSLFFNFQ